MSTSETCGRAAQEVKFDDCEPKVQIERLRGSLRHALSRIADLTETVDKIKAHKHDAHTGEPVVSVNKGFRAFVGGRVQLD